VFEKELELKSIIDGAANEEIRVWNLSGSYDPQDLFIVKADSLGKWTLQTISIFPSKRDNMYIEYSQLLRQSSVDSLKLNELWYIKSQSEVSNGDTYGCMDGVDVLIETANVLNYRLMWYRCPMINKGKDSVFRSIAELIDNLEAFASER
jgi:hypothetical protein